MQGEFIKYHVFVYKSMCHISDSYTVHYYLHPIIWLHVHSKDFHARSALSVQMFHLVVLRAVIGCATALTCSHMDTCFVTASSFQSAKATEMPSNKTGELPESTL